MQTLTATAVHKSVLKAAANVWLLIGGVTHGFVASWLAVIS